MWISDFSHIHGATYAHALIYVYYICVAEANIKFRVRIAIVQMVKQVDIRIV